MAPPDQEVARASDARAPCGTAHIVEWYALFVATSTAAGCTLIQKAPCGIVQPVSATATGDPLASGFAVPPDSAKPRVWWHWMNGNISKCGIDRDLEWMRRIGVGGLQHFDGALDTPQIVENRLVYMSTGWKDALRYAVQRADDLGLEFAIASSPGWSESGGPWVCAEDGMKKLVWSETRVKGGVSFQAKIPIPPSVSGPFQNLPALDLATGKPIDGLRYYQDIVVLGYPTHTSSLSVPMPISMSTSAPAVDTSRLSRADATQPILLPVSKDQPAWVLFDFGIPQQLRAASLSRPLNSWATAFTWVIEASADGRHFYRVAEFPDEYSLRHTTVAFPMVVERFARLTMTPVPRKTWFRFAANAPGAEPVAFFTESAPEVALYGLQFHSGRRVHRYEEKAGFAIAPDYYALDSAPDDGHDAIDPTRVCELTENLSADGELRWKVPEGEWTVLRLGYSLTGKTNHPASPEATGLEVDKLSSHAVKRYLDTYLGNFESTVGREWMGKRGIRAFLTDSIESQGQNWTPQLIDEFKARRGYSPIAWLPTLTGMIVGNSGRTDRFLWDFRQTLIELMSEAHYGQIAKEVHARNMIYYSESLEGYSTYAMGDDLDMRAPADIPMAAIWTNYNTAERDGILNHIVDMRGAASVAHVYGKPVVAVEALTSGYEPWTFCPASLRPIIDLAFALGINRPVIHTSVHQPGEKKPGVTLGPYGQHFTRHETWGEMAKPWITYLSRCSYLLQQGRHVADVAWFYGEAGSLAGLYEAGAPADLPVGYGFDFVNAHMLLYHLDAKEGDLVSSGGARYRLLYLGGTSERMTLSVLRKLKTLAERGIPLAGRRPIGSPSLADEGSAAMEEYRKIVDTLWESGKVLNVTTPNAAMDRLGVEPDYLYTSPSPDSSVLFLHRTLDQGELYFVTNRKPHGEQIEASFRITARKPELWHADTGKRDAVTWKIVSGRTLVSLRLEANQSVFVLFRAPAEKMGENIPARKESLVIRLDGQWELSFERGRGAPADFSSTALGSWTQSAKIGIRYFSGIGTYRKTFALDSFESASEERVLLDLGEVRELAEVTLNDQVIGCAWHPPFRLDVTEGIKKGLNTLVIRVANLWVNRLIGDKQPGATPVAFTVTDTYMADAPLRPSGLIGPVSLIKSIS